MGTRLLGFQLPSPRCKRIRASERGEVTAIRSWSRFPWLLTGLSSRPLHVISSSAGQFSVQYRPGLLKAFGL